MSTAISAAVQLLIHDAALEAGDCSGNADAADSMAKAGRSAVDVIQRLEWALEQARRAAISIDNAIKATQQQGGAA